MPKKFTGENSKAAAARDRKEAQKADAASKAAKAKDDAYWDEAEGKKSKAALKKADEARKRDEAAARKAENKRLAAEEEAAMATPKSAGKLGKVGAAGPKVTQHELRLQADAERRELEAQVDKRKAAARREVSEEDYARMVDVENTNRMDDQVDARSVNAALAALTVDDKEVDRHPERRAKAAWNAYYEEQLPLVKQEMPGLKLNQYKDKIWKTWQKSPQNPMNQPRPE